MSRQVATLLAFNRGVVSPLGLARVDQKRVQLSAEEMENWIARVLGSMSLRPGLGYTGATASNAAPRYLPFVFATTDTSLVEFTDSTMRVWINDTLLSRSSVSTTISNGTFSGNITGWTDSSDSGGAVAFDTGNFLKLTGNGTARAIATQALTVSVTDQSVEHGIKITVQRGPVTFRVGTSVGDDSVFTTAVLDAGVHSLGITPGLGHATIYLQFLSSAAYKVQVAGCVIESAGTVTITSPYLAADLDYIRHEQSADIVFIACKGYQQRKIERRGTRPGARSWSLCKYHADDGPFRNQNLTPTTLTPSATSGDFTIAASAPTFYSGHVDAIFSITEQVTGQSSAISAENTFTASIKVIGSGQQRSITITLTGTWVAVVSLQSSPDNSTWADVPGQIWNSNVSGSYLDSLDGVTMYYRIGIKAGNYTSGTVQAAITYTSGTLTGVVQITGYTSSTSVAARALSTLGSTAATTLWSEGSWSSTRGWPTAVRIHEGREWWFGQNGIFGSVSDGYYSFDDNVIGASGPINRSIGSGPLDTINWALSLQRLIVGGQGAEWTVKSSSLDVPISPGDFTVKSASTQGSGAVDVLRLDQAGVYVNRTATRIYEIAFDLASYEYASNDLTAVVPEFASPGLVRSAIQRKPDTRMHFVRSDGTVMLGIIDKVENVLCWSDVSISNGTIEDVVVLPGAVGSTEDQVYYATKRTINGQTARYLEKWAKETECRGGTQNKQADAFVIGTQAASTTISGLTHLVGQSVVCWHDGVAEMDSAGVDPQTFTVSASGTITVGSAATDYVVGLPYTAPWQSAKLGMASQDKTILNRVKRFDHLGLIAAWLHPQGLKFGADFDNLDSMPLIEDGTAVSQTTVRTTYDEQPIIFPGTWDSDARVCVQAQAPLPATLLAMTASEIING